MKKVFLLLAVVMMTLSMSSDNESDFCKGWEDGYQAAIEGCLKVSVTPVCPIPPVNRDDYKGGYGMGYSKGLKKCEDGKL